MSAKKHIKAAYILRMLSDDFNSKFAFDWELLESQKEKLRIDIVGFMSAAGDIGSRDNHAVFSEIAEEIFGTDAFVERGNNYTGKWCIINDKNRNALVQHYRSQDEVGSELYTLGTRAIVRALKKAGEELGLFEDQPSSLDAYETSTREIPASDRIVSLSDNQKTIIHDPLDEVTDFIEKQNSIGDESGLRELLLGRLRAGRELIDAGVFSIRSLHLTLVVGLQMVIERYKDHAIGAVAGNLLALLLKEYGL